MADIKLEITIPDANRTRVYDAFVEYAEKEIGLGVKGVQSTPNLKTFNYSNQGEKTPKEFVEDAVKQFILALVKYKEYNDDKDRYEAEVKAVNPPSESVPLDIIK